MLWDGTGAAPRVLDVLIHGEHIEAIAPDLIAPPDAQVIDGTGLMGLPGLIDSHVHVTSVPGSLLRRDSDATRYELVRHQLRAYLANGITTVLDCAIAHHELEAVRGWLELGHPGPDVMALGIPLSPPDGYIHTIVQQAPTFGTPEEISAHLDVLQQLGAAGVKVPMEEGFVFRTRPLHPPEMRAHISITAAEHDLPIYVHAMSPREYRLALEMDTHAMVHPPNKASRALIRQLQTRGTWVVSTISISDMFSVPTTPERLAAPHVRRTVPAEVLDTALDPEARGAYQDAILNLMLPKLPAGLRNLAKGQLEAPGAVAKRTARLQRSVRRMHEGGVRVVMGSDAGNWPQLPYSFHGPVSLREIELLGEAGMTPTEALLAATAHPAEMLGRQEEIGRVLPGLRADLVLVRGDPLEDLADLTDIAWTIRAGEARTPDQWMMPPDLPAPLPARPTE